MEEEAKPKLLVVEDDEDLAAQLRWALTRDYHVLAASDGAAAMELLARARPKVVTLDLGLPPDPGGVAEGFKLLGELLEADPLLKVIVVTGRHKKQHGLKAVAMGAHDYLTKPVAMEELRVILKRALHLRGLEEENMALEAEVRARASKDLIWASRAMEEVWRKMERVAKTDAPVLLVGESGTGKELAARAIHSMSSRARGPFVPIDCGAIPENLLESELFGHEKGAFTGAHTRRPGRVESANGGTLFLDEIGEMPPALQVKLLRFLQEQSFQRIGGRDWIRVDARVIAATNRDLEKAVREGSFREDLYYRLAVVVIRMPPLRERQGDVTLLAGTFLERFREETRKRIQGFTKEAVAAMESHGWPGNVRELENRVRRAVILAQGSRITASDLELLEAPSRFQGMDLRSAKDALERELVETALAKSNGNVSQAAQALGVSRPTLYDLMEKLGMRRPQRTPGTRRGGGEDGAQ